MRSTVTVEQVWVAYRITNRGERVIMQAMPQNRVTLRDAQNARRKGWHIASGGVVK